MKRSRKLVLTLLGAAATGAIVFALLPKPVPVDTAPAARGPIMVTVEEEGKTRVKERYTVSAPLSGRLLRIGLDPGDAVIEGKTLIAVIEPTAPDLPDIRAVAQAEARIRAAQASREKSVHTLKRALADHELAAILSSRMKQAHERKAVSRQDVDDAVAKERMAAETVQAERFGAKVAEFELEQAEAALLSLKSTKALNDAEPDRFEILSPISGVALRIFEESETVALSGDPLIELGDLSSIEVEVDVLSSDGARIRPGAKAYLERWGGDGPLNGRVRLVEPSGFTKVSALGVEEQRVNVIIDLVDPIEKWSKLGDGFRVDARIVVEEAEDVLKIPTGALFRQEGEWSVFVYQDGKALLRSVRIGKRNDLEAEALGGIDENTKVIAYPSDKIKDRTPVTPR